jgi:mercuric ion binding protein
MKDLSALVLLGCLVFATASAQGGGIDTIVPAASLQTVTLDIQNMDCPVCPFTVGMALEKVPGVAKVSVNFYAKTATVSFDPSKANLRALTDATGNAGFPSTVKK